MQFPLSPISFILLPAAPPAISDCLSFAELLSQLHPCPSTTSSNEHPTQPFLLRDELFPGPPLVSVAVLLLSALTQRLPPLILLVSKTLSRRRPLISEVVLVINALTLLALLRLASPRLPAQLSSMLHTLFTLLEFRPNIIAFHRCLRLARVFPG